MARSLHSYSLLPLFFAFLSLLHASKMDIERCGKDTVCFVNRCDGNEKDEMLDLLDDSRDDPMNTCKILLQIKKLNKTWHVLFLRIQKPKISKISVYIGKFVATLRHHGEEVQLKMQKYFMYYKPNVFKDDLIDIRLECNVDLYQTSQYLLYMELGDGYAMTNSDNRKAFTEKIEQTLTCSTDGLSNIENLPKKFQVLPVDFSDTKLSCSSPYSLAILTKDSKPVRIPPTICENNKWRSENYIKLDNFEGLKDFLNTSDYWKEDDDVGELYTIPETISIGCVKSDCSLCTPTWPVSNCPNCVQPQVIEPQDFECAILICPADYEFTLDGKTVSQIEPKCHLVWNDGNKILLDLSCLPTRIQTSAVEDMESSTAIYPKRNLTGKRRISTRNMDAEPKTGAGEWLRLNWVSSILVPVLIVGVVGGCIIFLVFMLRTKDEQDQLIREERRREEELEEYDAVSHERSPVRKTSGSQSGEALV